MKPKKALRKRRMEAARKFGTAALRESHAPDRIVAYAEREARAAAKEADRLARLELEQTTDPDADIQK